MLEKTPFEYIRTLGRKGNAQLIISLLKNYVLRGNLVFPLDSSYVLYNNVSRVIRISVFEGFFSCRCDYSDCIRLSCIMGMCN